VIEHELGGAGAGLLFSGRDPETGASLVVRRLYDEESSAGEVERWMTVSTRIRGVRNSHVVPVLGVGLREGAAHIVAAHVPGEDLAKMTAGRPLSTRQVLSVAFDIVEALTAAHAAGALHGNLKPSNVIVDGQGRATVSDFGLSPRPGDEGEETNPAEREHLLGWLPFAAPEVVREGPERSDERSDVYGLGAVMYFMLTGLPPFAGRDTRVLRRAVLEKEPAAPTTLNPRVPPAVEGVVLRALEKNPARRQVNVQALALELRRAKRRSTRWIVAESLGRKPRAWPRIAAVLVVLAALALAGYLAAREWLPTWFAGAEESAPEEPGTAGGTSPEQDEGDADDVSPFLAPDPAP
jgi:serine/threonine-protein kinase